jgi:4-amino-4-deoxy-L-arabinose transferase-like glycosyltransferase
MNKLEDNMQLRYTPCLRKSLRVKLALAVFVLIGAGLRLWDIQSSPPGLYHDEAFNGTDALAALKDGRFAAFYPANHGREGLFINLQAGSIWLFRDVLGWSRWPEPWMLRVVSAVFGILTLVALYAFARHLVGTREALLALFFLATSFWHVLFSREGFRAIASPLFVCLGFWLLLAGVAKLGHSRRSSLALCALAGAAFGLGFQTYIAFRPMLLLAMLVPLWVSRSASLKNGAAAAGVVALGFAVSAFPLLHYFIAHPEMFLGRAMQVGVWKTDSPVLVFVWNLLKTAQMSFVTGDFNWRQNLAQSPQLSFLAGVCVAAGALRLSLDLRRRGFRRDRSLLLAGLFLAAALGPALSTDSIPHALRSLQTIVPLMLAAGVGAAWIHRWMVRRWGVRRALAALLPLLALSGASDTYKYFLLWRNAPQVAYVFESAAVQAGYRLRSLPAETPKVVVVNGDPLIEARPAMYVADAWDEAGKARMHVRFERDSAAARSTPGAIVIDATGGIPIFMRP